MPFLKTISTVPGDAATITYPYTIPFIAKGFHLELHRDVTIFVGENGSGKSTLLEALAS